MDLKDESGEMTPTDIANFAVAAAGPSMYATKSEHTPPGNHSVYYTTRWDLNVPIENLKDSVVKVNFVEIANPNPSIPPGNMLIYTNIVVVNNDIQNGPYGNRVIASEHKLISGHYAQKAKIYKVLYEFVEEIRSLCKAGLPYRDLIYQISNLVSAYSNRNYQGKLIPEAAEMSPADLARHSIEVAGPCMYAKKIESYPESNFQHRSVIWLVEIPLSNPQLLPGQKVNIFIREFSRSNHELVIFITAKSLSPENRGRSYEQGIIVREARLLTVPWTDRAEAYKLLYEYVNNIREICQGPKYMVIMQEIANLTNSIQGYPPGREPKPEQESVETSSLELAAVLLEISVADLAKSSVDRISKMSQPFHVSTELGQFQVAKSGTVINYQPGRNFTNLTDAEEMEVERQLLQVVKFNVVEWIARYKTNVVINDGVIDLPDIGYWMKDGSYTPPDTDWRDMVAQYGGRVEPVGEAMTANDLVIQSVGLQIMAPMTHRTSTEGRDVRTYAWQNMAHGYTIQIRFTEHRVADRLLLVFTSWVEIRPTVYGGGSGFTIYDGDMSGKGDIYTRIWRALHDIKEAHGAGIDKEDLLDLARRVFHKEAMVSDRKQEEKGRPVI